MSAIHSTQSNHLGWTLSAIAGVLLFGAFTAWGGIPTDERAGIFWAQMGVLYSWRPAPLSRSSGT